MNLFSNTFTTVRDFFSQIASSNARLLTQQCFTKSFRNLTYTLQALMFVILLWMSGDVGRARKTAGRGRSPYGQAYSSP